MRYACDEYRSLLAARGITESMSRVGDAGGCHDNAPKESFWGTLKTEPVYLELFATRGQARAAIFESIEAFFNRVRLHRSLGYLSPERFEAGIT